MTRYLVRGRGRGGAGARAGAKADADADAKAEAKANPNPDLTRPHGAGVPERGVGLFYAAAAVGEEERHNEAWRGRGGAWGERVKASSREGRVLHLGRLAGGGRCASGKCIWEVQMCRMCVPPSNKGRRAFECGALWVGLEEAWAPGRGVEAGKRSLAHGSCGGVG